MKKTLFFLFAIASSLSFAMENPIGERAAYSLNDSSERSSWVIKTGKADAKIVRFEENDPEYGPGFIMEINYEMDVRFKGKQKGKINILVPEEVFYANFISEFARNHPRSYGTFDIDYLGMVNATDANKRSYNSCAKVKIFNVSTNYTPRGSRGIRMLSHESISFDTAGNRISAVDFEDLEIIMKVHPSLPVLGAVQLDVSGVAFGVSFKAGFDYKS